MKPKKDLLLNSACLVVISPLIGMMVAGIAVAIIEIALLGVGLVCGLIASLFFHVDFTSLGPRWDTVKSISMWIILAGGTIGGLVWSFIEVRQKWKKHEIRGTGW